MSEAPENDANNSGTVIELRRPANPEPPEPEAGAGAGKKKHKLAWLNACQVDNQTEPRPNLFNVMLALRGDYRLVGLFGFNEMTGEPTLMRPVPRRTDKATVKAFKPRPVQDVDVSMLQEFLQHAGLEKLGREVVHQAVDQRARELPFHPIRDYLDGLKWDGQERLSGWLETYLGAGKNESEDSDEDRDRQHAYLCAVGRMFLIGLVARVYKPGCKHDYMAVLEGIQGELKSSACRVLVGDDYFSDSLPPLHSSDQKRLSLHLRGKWLIEIAELSALGKAAVEELKAFVTRQVEKYTPPYARREVMEPRQCAFVGTTNEESYLRDATGGRRYWPIPVGCIDLEALARDRDQLWAEAVAAFKKGEQWWPERKFEKQNIQPEQEARYEIDAAWEDAIALYLLGLSWPQVTLKEVGIEALGLEVGKIGTTELRRIRAILLRLGWKRTDKKGTGGARWYVPTAVWEQKKPETG